MNPIQTAVSLMLIMSSVLLGFQVDRWWEEKRELAIELSYLERLVKDLETDAVSLSRRIEYFTGIRGFASQGLDYLKAPETGAGREEALLVAFYLASHAWEFTPASSTFEELKSSGQLPLIRDVSLRDAILVYHLDLTNANYVWKTPNYYRRTARSIIPADMQLTMWNSCHEMTEQASSQKFSVDCELGYAEDDISAILAQIRNSPVLEGDLNFLAANVDVSLVLYEQHLQRTRELLADLDEAISGGPKEEE